MGRGATRARPTSGPSAARVIALALAVLAVGAGVASAAGESPTFIPGEPTIAFNGGFSPKALSRSTPTPIALTIGLEVQAADGSPPPALSQLRLEFGKSINLDFDAIPSCPAGTGEDTDAFQSRCRRSLVGNAELSVLSPVRPPPGPAPFLPGALVYKRSADSRETTLGLREYEGPNVGLRDFPLYVRKSAAARPLLVLETQPSTFSTPITKLYLKIDKKVSTKEGKSSVVSAVCQEGKLGLRMTATFADGSSSSGGLVRTCTPKP